MDSSIALPYVKQIPVYEPGKPISETAREIGLSEEDIIKLASNENPIGVSERVLDAIISGLKDIARYPDGNGFALKQAIAERHGVEMNRVLLGNGSNDIIELVGLSCLAPGRSAVFSQHAFAIYALMTMARGAKPICVPSVDFGHDLEAMLAAIEPDTRLVMIANPNNPTGTYLSEASLRRFVESAPQSTLILLDEAYFDYLPHEDRFDTIAWTGEFDNLIVCRTLSKAYGLAGLRIGYAIAHPGLIDLTNRVRQPFNTNSLAQLAAVAALKDPDFLKRSYEVNRLGMAQICDGLTALGLDYIESKANFVTFKVPEAAKVCQALLQKGVIVRPLGGYNMPDHLRVSIGLQTENDKFLSLLGNVIQAT